ncbi:MAG: isoprenylcysteine carboxylmethyltransferase family protein [Ruminococcaceae bacterium]|nr:isoprenylcysteine carboxylmethyltransferase family protein [Oscillospiraceae bacterium]
MKLFLNALTKFTAGLLLVALLLFLPAGTIRYPGGLLFLCLLFIPMLLMGIVMLARARYLLAKRLDVKEKQGTQKGVVTVMGLIFVGGFILAGLDFRFGWSKVPLPVVIVASVLFLVGYALYAEVMRENAYLSRTIKVEEGQTVISTGLYAVVRHPMYTASTVMFLALPLILGSWYALIPFAFYPIIMVVRIRGEEKLLTAELSGYEAYKKKVRYRMIPFVW